MTTTSQGPEGHNSQEVKVGLRVTWSRGAMRMLVAGILALAGGGLVLLDRVVAALLPMAPVAAFMALIGASCIVNLPAQAVAPDNAVAPLASVTGDYAQPRGIFL